MKKTTQKVENPVEQKDNVDTAYVKPKFTITVTVNDTTLTQESNTLDFMFEGFPITQIKTKALVTVQVGDKEHTETILPRQFRRVLINKLAQEILLKKILPYLS